MSENIQPSSEDNQIVEDLAKEEFSEKFLTKTRKEWASIFFETDACVEPVLDFTEVEGNSQNQARKVFYRENNILQANIAPKFSRSVPQDHSNKASSTKTIDQILKEWNIE